MTKPRHEHKDPFDIFIGAHKEWDLYVDKENGIVSIVRPSHLTYATIRNPDAWSHPASKELPDAVKAMQIALAKATLLGVK